MTLSMHLAHLLHALASEMDAFLFTPFSQLQHASHSIEPPPITQSRCIFLQRQLVAQRMRSHCDNRRHLAIDDRSSRGHTAPIIVIPNYLVASRASQLVLQHFLGENRARW